MDRKDIVTNEASEKEQYAGLPENIQKKLEWFKDQKLGIIFHWGLYAEAGIVESWQLSEEDDWARKRGGWRPTVEQIREDYWALNKVFNPTQFNPEEWAEVSKKAGFKYMIFTTKHHDGFNMYDTAYSDYKITQEDSPFHDHPKADIFKEVAEAFREKGLAVGAYYSKADWYSPYYWVPGQHAKGRTASYNPKEDPETWNKFKEFTHNQLTELAKNYGPIDITWLDAGWVRDGRTNEDLDMDEIARKMREYNPDMLMVDRSVGGEHENYVTPERKIPEVAPSKAWESNIPHGKNWGYVPNEVYKSDKDMLQSIVNVVAMGGNLIIGVGPKPDGTLPEKSLELLETMGTWLDKYGEGIYDTRPYKINSIGNWHFTEKEDAIYAFCLPEEKETPLDLTMLELGDGYQVLDMESNKSVKVPHNTLVHKGDAIKAYKIVKGRNK
ncbi:alpha-L-fucosidase [Alkalibacterium iburiense]|uniref:alpha-L-fucosidase n=1 Tax=Alkalibacterium iburiense TaxID=290589 RepID=A0ABN0XIL1_9LACT